MYNESKKWFSQTLLYYEDRTYQTEGKLRVAISTNSSDDKNFNPPSFNISISHNFQKSCNLNIQQATDLVTAFKKISGQTDLNDVEIVRRISPKLEFTIKFKFDLNQIPVVEMLLISSSTDFTKIIVPTDIFSVLAHRLKNFVNNFDQLCYQLLMNNINGEYGEIIRQLPGLIKGISSQIITSEIPDSGAANPEPVEKVSSEQTIEDLDKFIGGSNMNNIDVPELESKHVKEETEIFNEVQSDFIEKIIGKDLSNLENILTNFDSSKNPVMDLNNNFIEIIGKDMNYIPNLEDDQLKSICYVSKLLCSVITQSHVQFGAQIPAATPILKYKVSKFKDENLNLAYDLLLFIAYMRNLRNRLSDKVVDFIGNKSRLYLQMRCYLDVFCFTFLEKAEKDKIRSIIGNRFKYFDSIGVFDKYKELLQKNNCPQITSTDIDSFVSEISEKIIGKSPFITELHDGLIKSNSFRIGSSNNFNLEQIINEVIPLEVEEKLGKDVKDSDAAKYVSAEVLNYFSEKTEPKVKKTTKTEKRSNLVRFANHYRNEIPEQHRDSFLKSLDDWKDINFEFDGCPWPLPEFGSNIIKGLYIWKPTEDPKLAKDYKYFFKLFEECILEKDHILAVNSETEQSSEWSNAFDNVTFE